MSISLTDILPPPTSSMSRNSSRKPPTISSADGDDGDDNESTQKDPWFKQHKNFLDSSSTSSSSTKISSMAMAVRGAPPYGQRKGWIPRGDDDFADGGAYPEILQAQFPLGLGRQVDRKGPSKTLALQLDAEGKVRYDAIVRHGHDKDKVVYSKLSDTKGSTIDERDETLQKPDDEEIQDLTEKTRNALEKITKTKIASALPVQHAQQTAPAQFIRYTPSQQGQQFNSGAQQRIIRMVEVQQDPMEPPKFKINQKIPRPPPSPPAPVLHSPTRKVTVKEQAEWKIPPCVSNWKNPKGFTVPLDKRMAADGRGLQQTHINENFAKLAEALYIADRKAREAVEMRSQLERKLAQKEKEEKEKKMREMAQKAREERAGIRRDAKAAAASEEADEALEREKIRHDRRDERRRDRNIGRAAPAKQAQLRRDKDRDISEKIALGLPDAKVRSDETQFDQRLFNQSKGLDSGGGMDDETYAVYDKPWRQNEGVSQAIYRPSKNMDKDIYGDDLDKLISTSRFVPDKGFAGADGASTSGGREGPVQFEKDPTTDDPFGLGELLRSAKEGRKRGGDKEGGDRERDSKRRK